MRNVLARALLAGAVALRRRWEFVGSGFWCRLGWHESVIAGRRALVGVFLFLVVRRESGDKLKTFETFGEGGIDVLAVFGSPSSHPFVDIFRLVELADVRFDGTNRLFDVFFLEGVPVAAPFAEHHDPDFVNLPRFEALA